MKNKKGMTIIEILTAIILISIVLVFMLNLLITVQNFGAQNQTTSDLLVNQAVVIKALEKDINDNKLIGISNCTSEDLTKDRKYPIVSNEIINIIKKTKLSNDEKDIIDKLYCLKLTFDNSILGSDNEGFLVQYTYNYSNSIKKNIVGYKRSSNQTVRESSISMKSTNNKGTVKSSCSETVNENCSLKITMPILDDDGNNYDIVATYIYSSNGFTYTKGTAYGFVIS